MDHAGADKSRRRSFVSEGTCTRSARNQRAFVRQFGQPATLPGTQAFERAQCFHAGLDPKRLNLPR